MHLIEEAFENYLAKTAPQYNPYIFTAIGMILIFVCIYFLFIKMEDWVNTFIEKVLKFGKNIISKKVGMLLIFFIILFVIYWFYLKMWYNIDIWLKLIS